jgi:hypothetical protein
VTRQADEEFAVLPALLAYREAAPRVFTPPPVTSLEAAGRRRRRSRAAMATAAAVIVLTVSAGAAVAVLSRPGDPRPGETAPATDGMGLRYSPTWVPPGLREVSRTATLDLAHPTLVRTWTTDGRDPYGVANNGRLQLNLHGKDAGRRSGEPVDISGRLGFYNGAPQGRGGEAVPAFGPGRSSSVVWMPDDETVLVLSDTDLRLPREDMLRMARSVRPDPGRLASPLQAGWMPDDMVLTYLEMVGDSSASWQFQLTYYQRISSVGTGVGDADSDAKLNGLTLQLWIGPTAPARTGGAAITVNGRPARLVSQRRVAHPRDVAHVVIDFGLGTPVTVTGIGPWDHADLVRIAENLEVRGLPDLSWLGR